jgi:hypothetical protein
MILGLNTYLWTNDHHLTNSIDNSVNHDWMMVVYSAVYNMTIIAMIITIVIVSSNMMNLFLHALITLEGEDNSIYHHITKLWASRRCLIIQTMNASWILPSQAMRMFSTVVYCLNEKSTTDFSFPITPSYLQNIYQL